MTTVDRKLFVVGEEGNAAFQASNFQSYRDNWVFQPSFHWTGAVWQTSGMTIDNGLQTDFFSESDDAVRNAPFLSYFVFLDNAGEYDIWGYGFISNPGLFWAWGDDETHLRRLTLGEDTSAGFGVPRWTKIGRVSVNEAGVQTFTVYLSDVESILLDQWYITRNFNFESDLEVINGFATPISNSRTPFTTAVRLRPLIGGNLSPLEDNPGITAWSPSNEIIASGKANYAIQDNGIAGGVTFSDGVSIEFWQIGGNADDYAAWNYTFDDTSAGNAFQSSNYGQDYTIES